MCEASLPPVSPKLLANDRWILLEPWHVTHNPFRQCGPLSLLLFIERIVFARFKALIGELFDGHFYCCALLDTRRGDVPDDSRWGEKPRPHIPFTEHPYEPLSDCSAVRPQIGWQHVANARKVGVDLAQL